MSDRPTNSSNSMTTARPAQAATEKPRLIEIELRRKYCPHYLVADDGSVAPNEDHSMVKGENGRVSVDPTKVLKTIAPGIVKMHSKDALIVLRAGIGVPTVNAEL